MFRYCWSKLPDPDILPLLKALYNIIIVGILKRKMINFT